MDIPTDRHLIMVIVATGFAVLIGDWAGGLVHAEATGLKEIGLRVGLGVVFFAILLGLWYQFERIVDDSSEEFLFSRAVCTAHDVVRGEEMGSEGFEPPID